MDDGGFAPKANSTLNESEDQAVIIFPVRKCVSEAAPLMFKSGLLLVYANQVLHT